MVGVNVNKVVGRLYLRGACVKPVLQAILVAEHVYTDKDSGKKIVAGIFRNVRILKESETQKVVVDGDGNKRFLLQGGVTVGSPHAYISMTAVRGTQKFVVRYVRLNDDKPFFSTAFSVECNDPLNVIEIVLPLPRLPMKLGIYALELLCEDEPIGAFRIVVDEMKDENHDNSNA